MQTSKLYVGNLDYSVTEQQLRELFEKYGEIENLNIIEGRGFGFVEMVKKDDAIRAKEELNDSEFEGRKLRISEARPRDGKRKGRRHGSRRNY